MTTIHNKVSNKSTEQVYNMGGNAEPQLLTPVNLGDMSGSRIWREFSAGMSLFIRGVGRVNVKLNAMARVNMRLLHGGFLESEEYRHFLLENNSNSENSWSIVASENGIHCSFLTLATEQEITISSVTSRLLQYCQCGGLEDCLLMFYVVSGKVSVQYQKNSQQPAYLCKDIANTTRLLKSGQACIHLPGCSINSLRTHNDSSQVLIAAMAIGRSYHTEPQCQTLSTTP